MTESNSDTTAIGGAVTLTELYRRMLTIRKFEDHAARLYRATQIPGFLHLSIGQEASAVGACWPLDDRDVVTSTHRGHGHCIAKGLDVEGMFAELMGKETGTCRGRGGSMHIADPRKGIFGANGIVGAGLPIAVGAGTAAQLRDSGGVVVAFFGDGAVAQGVFHESVNLAAVWDLPVIFFCENNGYSEFSAAVDQHRATLRERAAGYGVEFHQVDGNDVVQVATLQRTLVDRLRAGAGPVIVEASTYRWHGHYEGDPESYRDAAELAAWKERDPLTVLGDTMRGQGLAEHLAAIEREVDAVIESAIEKAVAAPYPAEETAGDYVITPRAAIPEPATPTAGSWKIMHAVTNALTKELADDPTVFLAGIDVGKGGNVYGLTRGLAEQYPGRVRDTPISESAIMGTAVGAAMAGYRPVVELMYFDFIGVCLDQLMNQAAKLRFMTGGAVTMPLVVRTQFGAGKSSGSQHSQSLEALVAHIPGLTVVMPSTPADTYGLLRAAIQDPNPVIFIENRLLYGMKGAEPPADHLVPLGKAIVRRPGTDVTVVSYSKTMYDCLAVADRLAAEGISVEVIDLRTISPLDFDTVLTSLQKTNRLVVVHQAVGEFGVGAELAARAVREGFWHLDAPVIRVTAGATPAPYTPALEKIWLPDEARIEAAIRETLDTRS
ncbi:dehydrogenase E1 component subunit alpha/beta [Nocardia sp. NBC_00565]|uniref:alpha-ketoacid dehydrogenase subunit alpha/beta n=1 Tax=Nocardia sp. NBC_00565 TaxID=2975993 RepID=UPI002E8157E0|nr:dehydrogenase E1 component subunit alpha/beta [Nocardia sp. NBC_00565]WUC06379.1 dehydrogenase E1 component subunit alpha/beta [Nocardia sp. NBC_00565]